ncbi:terminase small subunit [Methylocaldum sp. GT1BB]|uniref:terminase small subunit n=1 Tax=Methylocaldum sp. GT1BB TaxID=3438963 RepID=UPI003DA08076
MSRTKDPVTGLTPQQERFVQEILQNPEISQSEAYRRAYPLSRKWAEKTVWEKASVLAANDKVKARLRDLRLMAQEVAVLDEARVLREIARIGLADPRKAFDAIGNLRPVHEWPDDLAAAVASVKVTGQPGKEGEPITTIKEIRFWDKNAALEKLCRHLGLYERDNRQKAGLFDGVPRETLKMIEAKLRQLTSRVH